MATVTFYQPADMLSTPMQTGTLVYADSTSIRVDGIGYYDSTEYYGSFEYESYGVVSGGELVRVVGKKFYYSVDPTTGSDSISYINFIAEDFVADAATFASLGDLGDISGAQSYILANADTMFGSKFNDSIKGWGGEDTLYGYDGDDLLFGDAGNDLISGGAGTDLSGYAATESTIIAATQSESGDVTIRTGFGTDTLVDIEGVVFYGATLSIAELISHYVPPDYHTSNGYVQAQIYTGPVGFLDFQLIVTDQGESVNGSSYNDFIVLLGGDDAANGGGGRDVLDGGAGSNFLTGGADHDVFFLDGRGGDVTWSTITDFTAGDHVNIWGWEIGVSRLLLAQENQGASGHTGATLHYDLDGDNFIDTSLTFSRLSLAALPTPSVEEVDGNSYLLFA